MLTRAPFIDENMESYMKHIIGMIVGETSATVKLRVLQGIVYVAELRPDLVLKEDNFPNLA
jgi:hypothetical protein